MDANKVNLKVVNPKTDGYIPDKMLEMEVEDQIAARSVTASDGRRFVIRSKDPYGMWEVTPRRGPTPEMLSGLYTSQGDAEKAIIQYCSTHPLR